MNMSFNKLAAHIVKKVAKKINFRYRISKYVCSNTLVTIYKSIVAPF